MKATSCAAAASVGVLLVLSMVSLACHRDGDPVRDCLDALTRAVHDRDAGALMDRVAADFRSGEGSSRADAESLVRRSFAAYENLGVTLSAVTIERSENGARVRFRATLSGQPRKFGGLDAFFPRSSTYDFDLRLVPENGKWQVAWAQWKQP